jgi:alkanesulfonate monooxygenase SsuD/methylene tetrahydromethanopterin reductase-like flavin-dependent oxidoreductase (luciferase family)
MLPTAADPDHGRVDAKRVLDAARLAEAAGFDGVYVADHLVHPRPLLESVVTLTAVAASTARVTIGFCVLLVTLRPTVVLAKELATLATFAPGRLRIGVGVGGEYPPEFAIAGVPLAERGRRTEVAVRRLRSLLAGRPTTVEGVDGVEIEVTIAPAAPGTVPVVFAGWNEAALRRAAMLGDGWIGYLLAPDSFARRRSLLLECRADLGFAAPFTTGMLLPVSLDDDAGGAAARAASAWSGVIANGAAVPDHLFVAGPPAAVLDQLHEYWERGCTDMVLSPVDQGAGFIGQVEVLAADVLPRVRAFGSSTATRSG